MYLSIHRNKIIFEKKFKLYVFRSPVVRRPSVCKVFTFSSSSPEPLGQFQPNLIGKEHPWVKGIQVCSKEGPFR